MDAKPWRILDTRVRGAVTVECKQEVSPARPRVQREHLL